MKDVEIIGILKSFINQTLVGMGAQKGAPCTIKSITDNEGVHTVTFEWTDTAGVKHESQMIVRDGAKGDTGPAGPEGTPGTPGAPGEPGTDGISPEITVKTSTGDTYILTITTATGSFDTPNLKGGGGGGASKLSELSDVDITDLEVGDVLVYQEKTVEGQTVGVWVVARPLASISVNGVTQTITDGAVDLDIAANLIKETQWTSINALYA